MIVIPARNEGPRVGAVVRAVRAVLPGVGVLVVENGSEDDTAAQAERAGAEVLTSPTGYASALKVGLAVALERGAAWVVQMDADGQHPASALPGLLAALPDADLVVGSRFLAGAGYRVPLARRFGIAVLSSLASQRAGARLTDVTSGLRVWSPRALAALLPCFPEPVADGNLLVAAARAGLRVREVPVAMLPRQGGTSMHAGMRGAVFAARSLVATLRG